MAGKDITEKTLIAYTDVFADIVNALLFKGPQIIKPEDLVDQLPRSIYKADGKIREIERDVLKSWIHNMIRIACIGIENETEPDVDMVLRVPAYNGAEYRAQLLKENRGNPRYPVVTLVLYFGYKNRWNAPKRLSDRLLIPDVLKPYVDDVKLNLFEIAYLSDEELGYFHSDFRVVADYFVQMQRNGDYVPGREELDHVEAVLQLLSVMTDDRRFEDVLNDSEEPRGGVRTMCDVLDRVEAKGRVEGRIEGKIEGKIEGAIQTLDLLGKQPSEIISFIIENFGLEKDRAEKYVEEVLGLTMLL